MGTHRNTKLYREERKWFLGASTILLIAFVGYVYFLSASVHHVVIRKEANQEIARTSSYVSQLESEYIEAQHLVSAEIASRAGFVETDDKVFIERGETSLVLSGNGGS